MPAPNKKIFCNTPWYELHIYWDGGLGICCQEYHRLYDKEQNSKFNIANMSIRDWFNSEPVKKMRMALWGDEKISACHKCMQDEQVGLTSRRHRSNQKSVIFTKAAFEESFLQSPHHDNFLYSKNKKGYTQTLPIDLHVDLGNFCNLACKMCHSQASSKIAVQRVKWGHEEDKKYVGSDWTRNEKVWTRFLNQLADIKLQNIHFMGGETILTKRFHDFLNFMIEQKRFDLNFSFVTNGTTFDKELIEKLKLFKRVGIEVSIETLTTHNSYVRQGTDTKEVLSNIEKYKAHCDNNQVSVTIRPAPSALTIGNYHTVIEYCMEQKLTIKSNAVWRPTFLNISVLPMDIRKEYLKKYHELLKKYDLESLELDSDFNESDPQQYKKIIKLAITQAIGLLNAPMAKNYKAELISMVEHCKRWDKIYGLNAIEIFPEFKKIFVQHGYKEI